MSAKGRERAWMVRGAELVRVFTEEQEARDLAAKFDGAVIPLVDEGEADLWKDRYEAERADHEATMKHCDEELARLDWEADDGRGR